MHGLARAFLDWFIRMFVTPEKSSFNFPGWHGDLIKKVLTRGFDHGKELLFHDNSYGLGPIPLLFLCIFVKIVYGFLGQVRFHGYF